jgi:hypothetical protein
VDDCCMKHDPHSPLLYGEVTAEDIVKMREMKSFKDDRLNLFG